MKLTHCVRPPLVNLCIERMVRYPVRCNRAGAPLGRPPGMQQTRQKNLLPFFCVLYVHARVRLVLLLCLLFIEISSFHFFSFPSRFALFGVCANPASSTFTDALSFLSVSRLLARSLD